MNIDFSRYPAFSSYVLLLLVSGVLLLVLSSARSTTTLRVLNVVFGVGFVGYGFYLAVLFEGGSYLIFFKAFIVPLVLAYQTWKSWREGRRAAPAGDQSRPASAPLSEQAPSAPRAPVDQAPSAAKAPVDQAHSAPRAPVDQAPSAAQAPVHAALAGVTDGQPLRARLRALDRKVLGR